MERIFFLYTFVNKSAEFGFPHTSDSMRRDEMIRVTTTAGSSPIFTKTGMILDMKYLAGRPCAHARAWLRPGGE